MSHPKSNKILVFGARGFIGKHLSAYLRSKDHEIIETDLSHESQYRIDALDKNQVQNIIKEIKPEVIYNLIGYTDESKPELVYRLNIFPFINIVQSVESSGLPARIITLGSAAEYGCIDKPQSPLREDDTKMPVSHYGVSKSTQTLIAKIFYESKGLDIIVARPFNILGPGMALQSVPACFIARFIEEKVSNGKKIIHTRGLDSVRDFLTIEDVIRALYVIMVKGKSGESYNICSGKGIRIRDIFNKTAAIFYQEEFDLYEEEENKINNIPWSIGDNSKLLKLGWQTEGSIENEIQKMVEVMKKKA